jgi:DinB superfamily
MADASSRLVPDADRVVRDALVFNLRVGDAHQTFDDAVADFPSDAINMRPPNLEYTFWQLVEHVRFCQADMLDYLDNGDYEAVTFPDDYWPARSTMASEQRWNDTIDAYRRDLDRVEAFVRDAGLDLFAAAAHVWEPHHTPLHTVLVMADHAAYHGGELGILRQVMGLWAPDRVDHFTVSASVTQNVAT